ncbi:MAG: hypothetical protein A3F46_00115 [Legionellales bacterium RIFCSPHIGHO2_12_FULL_42_9]|nr:MAG: hypothetical protein A3F46_00115 [Legionellales bacterium RIFCSPHIGHO2_12_FULL_42_9]
MKTCAVIPAAGLGTRLKTSTPKILLSLTPTKTVWSVLRFKLVDLVDHIHVIVSPHSEDLMRRELADDLACGLVSISVQVEPIGMGDAIFQGYSVWSQALQILIVWGDQVFVSSETFKSALQRHAGHDKTIALPLTIVTEPYVEYIFDADLGLTAVKQSREGDRCSAKGLADVGTFVMSVRDLLPAWHAYLKRASWGAQTNEINFLPFLPFLAANGWHIELVHVASSLETRGINTPEDLLFFRCLLM